MTRRPRLTQLLTALLAITVGLVYIAPVLWMTAASLKPDDAIHAHVDSINSFIPTPLTTHNYVDATTRGNVAITLLNSLLMTALIALGGLLINSPAAYAFARLRFPGRDWLFTLLVATIIVPLEALVIPLFVLVRTTRGLEDILGEWGWTLAALSLPFVAKAFNIFLLRQAFLSLPRALEEAAFIDGAGWIGTFWRIGLPNIKHTLVTVVLIDFVIHWNDFLWPLVVCRAEHTRTIQLGLGDFFTQPPIAWGAILAYAVIATIPVLFAFTLGQRWIVRSLAATGIRE